MEKDSRSRVIAVIHPVDLFSARVGALIKVDGEPNVVMDALCGW
jgi:hypothetical protein